MFDVTSNAWEFPIEEQPVFDSMGNTIPGHKAIVRTDSNEVLGLHGSRYKAVTHDDCVNSLIDSVKSAGISDDWDLKVECLESGRKMRGEILFNDLTVEPQVGDYVKFKVDFFNSYDGSWSFSQTASGLRLWCLNGCTTADAVARSKYKHTSQLNVDGSAAKIAIGIDHFMNRKDEWQRFMQVKLDHEQVETFFKKTVARAPTRQLMASKTNEKQLENLLGIWRNEVSQLGQNKWALYNCLTYWATHTDEMRSPHTARYNRETAIAAAMKTKLWEEMV